MQRWRVMRARRAGGLPRRLFASAADSPLSPLAERKWPTRRSAASVAMIVEALRVFHAREGHFAVPYRFVVPVAFSHSAPQREGATGSEEPIVEWPRELRGFPLGVRVHGLARSTARGQVAATASRKWIEEQLAAMDFPLVHWRDYWFDHMYLRPLEAYRRLEGDLFVPQKFVVPTGDSKWPRASWGDTLGVRVDKLRRQRDELPRNHRYALDALGFVWSVSDTKWNKFFLPSLRRFHELHGHTDVPLAFVVPSEDPRWPRRLAGYRLGRRVRNVRSGKYAEQAAASQNELHQLGFSMSLSDKAWKERIFPALEVFVRELDHCDVPHWFVVPPRAPWPSATWGLKLGKIMNGPRRGEQETHARTGWDKLQQLGFSMNLSEIVWKEHVFPALRAFAREYGHCDVPHEFVVPAHAPWPPLTWDLKLGYAVNNIRRGAYKPQIGENRAELEELGFIWNAQDRVEKKVRNVVLPALEMYRRVYGNQLVSMDFVVPESDETWPPQTRGFRLGQWVRRVRAGRVELPPHLREELDASGFVWRFYDSRWNDVLLPSFRTYKNVHGSCEGMPTSFIVPHAPPYPRPAWGVRLGDVMWHIRNRDAYASIADQHELCALGVLE